MQVKNLLRKEYEVIAPYIGVASIEDKLLIDSFLVVLEEGRLHGILTPADIVKNPHRLVIDCLTQKPWADCEAEIGSILKLMKESHNHVLPVCKENIYIGVVVQEDITYYLSKYRRELEEKVTEYSAELEKTIEQLQKQVTKRVQVEEELKKHNDQLEDVVRERTTELEEEISERKRAEEQIKDSLKEKETLLHEVHHRVKNNMAVISSLLKLQSNSVKEEKFKEALMDSQYRIQAMSMIHESLYGSENLSSIDMNEYLLKLARMLIHSYSAGSKVNLKIKAENIIIGVKQASPIGLIMNELITNSNKYAFPNNQGGEIIISFTKKRKSNRNNL